MNVPHQGTELYINVQIQEIRELQRELQRVVTQVRGGQWVLAALFFGLACCLVYCTIHIKRMSETLTTTHKSVGELSESFRESSESFTKEMKEINSSLITSLRNLTETMVEFHRSFVKEIQEMKASPYKLQNQTKNFSVADVKDSRAFSDSLSAEFSDESAFARLMEGLVTNIQHVFEWMYHEKNKLVVDAAEYISKIEKTKLFGAAQYIFATIMVVFAYKEICRRIQNSNAYDQAGNAYDQAANAHGHVANAHDQAANAHGHEANAHDHAGNVGGRGRNAGERGRNARGRKKKTVRKRNALGRYQANLVLAIRFVSSVCFPLL